MCQGKSNHTKCVKENDHAQNARERARVLSINKKIMFLMACKLSGKYLEVQGIFKRAGDIILHFWRHGTLKQYSSYIRKWIHFVVANKLIVFPQLHAKHYIF